MKIFKTIIYIAGFLTLGSLIHELYHYYHCGGTLVAGFYLSPDYWTIGTVWCNGWGGGETIPSILEIGFYLLAIYAGLKKDKIK